MTVERENERFESYLREFQARDPRPLPQVGACADAFLRYRRLAAAAALVLACGTSGWLALRRRERPISTTNHSSGAYVARIKDPAAIGSDVRWTQLALERPAELDAALAKAPGAKIPQFDRDGGVLRILSKD
jgi:hypothetical protein